MEEELREKIFQMHGTVERLEQKTDNMIKHQGRIDKEISSLETQIGDVEQQAKSNQRKLYAVYVIAGIAGTIIPYIITVYTSS